jgi:UDP-N-acetylmuramoyl-L-alanyl-D-glutamate--2,6-diaminopimelate ligase
MTDEPVLLLKDLLRELPTGARLSGDGGVAVRGVHQDSRRVEAGDLFVAMKGARSDGGKFVADALARGAAAVMTEEPLEGLGVPLVRVADIRVALALASAAVYGHPAFSLDIIGITGTNGKTTTAHLVRRAIDGALGKPACGIVGTVGHSFAALRIEASHTTPEADELARILRSMRDAGATHVAMEVSSIALASRRAHAIRFRVAAFTNLTQDHLDYHGTMEAYAAAKAELFTSYAPGAAVIHVDDPFGRELAERVSTRVVRVSAKVGTPSSVADIAPETLELSSGGIRARLRVPDGKVELESPLYGAHNVENLLVALGVVVALDLDVERAAAALRNEVGAGGRLERCESAEDDIVVLVDYAHTPDALARVLSSVRAATAGRVVLVFGCGGDRDRAKRGPMGRAAGEGADLAVVTNDNPRSEPPEAIASAVVGGLEEASAPRISPDAIGLARRGYFVELDRREAISAAIRGARSGDTVVIAGKGHETYQDFGATRVPFDDRAECRRALAERRASA